MIISAIMINVLGKERIISAKEKLAQHITEIDPDKLNWGVEYMFQYLKNQMNIFATDQCPRRSAQVLPDKHVVKMPLESCQMLSIIFFKVVL